MNSQPPLGTTQHPLRFGDLSAADFERMCLGLLQLESDEWQQVQHYGQAGNDQGRDLMASRNGARWVVQCKRTQTFQPNQITPEVDKCNALNAALRPVGILFITSANVTATTRDEINAYCQARGFACEIWGRTDLDARVNRHPQLVAQFFGAAAAVMNPALHQVAPPVADFVGRVKEIAELTAHLQPNNQHSQTVAIASAQGSGGIGKTQLALKLVDELRAAYPDAQLFINLRGVAEQPVTPVAALQEFIRALEPAARAQQLPDDVSQLRGLYLSLLAQRRALVVCDNARDRAQVEPLIPPAGCALIVTSRVSSQLAGMRACHLDKLAPDEARDLLKQIVPHLSEAEADKLARLCGYFPQALRVYGNFLAERPNYPAERYAARITQAQAQGELEPEIAAAFATSYEDLLDAVQQRYWRQLAVFVSDFDAAAAAAVWQLDENETLDVLSELRRYSLIEFDAARVRYWLHDLARVYAQGLLTADERDASESCYAAHYCDVLYSANKLYEQGEPLAGLARYDAERIHIAAGFAWATAQRTSDPVAAYLCLSYPWAILVLALRLHSREQIEWLNTQLAAARQLRNRQAEGAALGNLGLAYAELGEMRQAIGYYEKALLIAQEIGDRRGEGAALGNLGSAYKNLGEVRQAMRYYEQRLVMARKIGDRRGEGNTLGNTGLAYMALGEVRQATRFYEQQLVIVRKIGDRRGESAALGNLGIAYNNLGEVQQAIEHCEQALVIDREIGDRRGEAIASWNLADVLHKQGETERARSLAQTALQLFEAMESPYAATVRAGLAEWEAAA